MTAITAQPVELDRPTTGDAEDWMASALGPLEVTVSGVSIVPPAMKAKQLLALLVLNRGRIVQIGTIERELWDCDPPRNAATAIQNCVMQIRKRMETALHLGRRAPGAKELLRTEAVGYQLRFPDEHVDLRRYEALIATARSAESANDLAGASELLQQALDLWHGDPFADVAPGPALRSELLRLREGRRSVHLRRIGLDLRQHRYQELIGELRALTMLEREEIGYDETLYAYLMFALYQAGRRNEALTVYRDLRRELADEVGLEPTRTLQDLHQKIMIDSAEDPVALSDLGLGACVDCAASPRPIQIPGPRGERHDAA
jgi:SARP family transcriptional regulator, regulator of embCAB operon